MWRTNHFETISNKEVNFQNKLYNLFANSIEKSSASQKLFYDELKKNGYNAVVDEHDITGSWMQGRKPLIIMDVLSVVGNINVSTLSIEKMKTALDELMKQN